MEIADFAFRTNADIPETIFGVGDVRAWKQKYFFLYTLEEAQRK